jgi:hypothetical protein
VVALVGCGSNTATESNTGTEQTTQNWTLTTYYTAVESFHSGPPQQLQGCLVLACSHGRAALGSYPGDFVQAVRDEGTGRITDGEHRGGYLNWSYDVGFWLDTVPRDTDGGVLRPYVTAAADDRVLSRNAGFRIVDCGQEKEDGSPIDAQVCQRLKASSWVVLDAFTPGLGGPRHLDLYIGEEDRVRFLDTSPASITTTGSVIRRAR